MRSNRVSLLAFVGYATLAGAIASKERNGDGRSTSGIIIGGSILGGILLLIILSALYCRFCTKGKRIRRQRRNTLIAAITLEAAASRDEEDSAEESINDDVILPVCATHRPNEAECENVIAQESRPEEAEEVNTSPVASLAPPSRKTPLKDGTLESKSTLGNDATCKESPKSGKSSLTPIEEI